ncbi:hypothetical protein ACIRUY_21405 [Streptomyces erythrochromogenes]|uniref:hypothetical protein n=1 Tax=Streptomyces erythrochromogenes TaxID=285574 RepID=UPI0037F48F58
MESWQCSPSADTVPRLTLDPYRFPGADRAESLSCDDAPQEAFDRNGPSPLGAADPQAGREPSGSRPAPSLKPWDRRRLDLHAALTAVGVPPLPGDMAAIRTLSALDDTVNAALVRWITAGR